MANEFITFFKFMRMLLRLLKGRTPLGTPTPIYSATRFSFPAALFLAALIGLLVLDGKTASAEEQAGQTAESALPDKNPGHGTVTIRRAGPEEGQKVFRIVLKCNTIESRARGLQGFRNLERDEAALFVFDKPEPVMFWMGTVAFPIDIFFVASNGNVVAVYPDRKPADRSFFPSGSPVHWAIETAAGSGVKVGDRVKLSAEFGVRSSE